MAAPRDGGHSNSSVLLPVRRAFEQCVHRPTNVFRLSLTSKAMAYSLGICLHLLHICLRMDRMQSTAQFNCSWQDSVDADGAWVDWVSRRLLTVYDSFIQSGCRQILDA